MNKNTMMKEVTYNSPSVKKMLETIKRYMAYSEWKEKYEIVIEKEMKKYEESKTNRDNSS